MEANTASDADLLHSLDRFWSLLAKTSNMTINFNEYQHFYLSLVKTLDLGLGADSDYTPFDCARMDWTKQLSIQYDQHLEANESFGLEMTQRSFNRSLFEVVYQR